MPRRSRIFLAPMPGTIIVTLCGWRPPGKPLWRRSTRFMAPTQGRDCRRTPFGWSVTTFHLQKNRSTGNGSMKIIRLDRIHAVVSWVTPASTGRCGRDVHDIRQQVSPQRPMSACFVVKPVWSQTGKRPVPGCFVDKLPEWWLRRLVAVGNHRHSRPQGRRRHLKKPSFLRSSSRPVPVDVLRSRKRRSCRCRAGD